MRILMTGATGLIGRALTQRLLGEGHGVVAWVRSPDRARSQLGPAVELVEAGSTDRLTEALEHCDAVVNLAGENVMAERWTESRRNALDRSRVARTEALVEAMKTVAHPPRVLVSASAVGIYGDRGDLSLSEHASPGDDWLAQLCVRWEQAALSAESLGTRVATLRIGIVLGQGGGVLNELWPLFHLGLGGRLGAGKHHVPWIHIDDLVEMLRRALLDPRVRGALNATAPRPVTNRDFTQTLASVMRRPARLPAPAWALRLLLGARAQVVLASTRALPARFEQLGFHFRFHELGSALRNLLIDNAPDIQKARSTPAQAPSRASHVLRQDVQLPVEQERGFEFFCSAENLGLITPDWMAFEITRAPAAMATGALIDYRIRFGPLPMTWRTRIARFDAPEVFVDSQERGPYRLWWHEHRLSADSHDGVVMRDQVHYRLPLGPLGRLAHALWVAPTLRRIFAYRAEAIGRLYGATASADAAGHDQRNDMARLELVS